MDREGAIGWRTSWRATIRDLALLIAVAEFLYWLVRRADTSEALFEYWWLVSILSTCVLGLVWSSACILGMVWSIRNIYRVGPSKQTPPIAGLIGSLAGLVSTVFVCAIWMSFLSGD